MLRNIAKVVLGAAIGYVAGTVFGYRAAVVDYVENDAATIERMANSMYETADSFEDLPDDIQEEMKKQGLAPDEDSEDENRKGFQ